MLRKISTFVLPLSFLIFSNCSPQSNEPQTKPTPDSTAVTGYELVWSDEFNYTGLPDSKKWSYDVGAGGWGNQELEYYTDSRLENAYVENGKLIIQARMESYKGSPYTSVRLLTKNKGDWTYGRVEVRAKLPYGKGTWPAIWMLPTVWNLGDGGWPDNGEIDIMEHVGYDPGIIHGSTHCNKYVFTKGTQKTATINIPSAMFSFHNYIMEWTKDNIKMYVDDKLYFTSINEGTGWQYWPFFKNFHLILNIAVGGSWGGAQGIDTSIFPQKMEVQYVRVYKKIN